MFHQLIVCKSCGFSVDEEKRNGETGGAHLLKHLESLYEQWPRKEELTIETTGCLCICERPCAIAYVGTRKPTYLFADLDPATCAADLLAAAELYLDSKDGMVSAYTLPKELQPCRIARIPSAPLCPPLLTCSGS
jgi:predicted metal-binding protein